METIPEQAPIEYEKYGRVTFRFPESEVVLRRPLLGDLEFGDDLLDELNEKTKAERDEVREELNALIPAPASSENNAKGNALIRRLNETRYTTNFAWLTAVFERMGTGAWPNDRAEWPAAFFAPGLITDIITHWTTRPLASGNTTLPTSAPSA